MKRITFFLFSIVLLTACGVGKQDNSSAVNSNTASSDKSAAAKPPAIGDLVVAHWAGNTWSEGKVDSINGPRAKIIWSDNASPSEVDLVDIYQMPKAGGSATVKAGDYVITTRSTGTTWEGAQDPTVRPGVGTDKQGSDLQAGTPPP